MSKTPYNTAAKFDLLGDRKKHDEARLGRMTKNTSGTYNPGVAGYTNEKNAYSLWLELKQLHDSNSNLDRQKEIYDELDKLGELDRLGHSKAGGRTKRRTFKGKKPKSKRASGSSLKKRKTKRKQRK